MARKAFPAVAALLLLAAIYFAAWPVPIEPVAWQAPPNPGYHGEFAANQRLGDLEHVDLGGLHGPEAVVADAQGRLYVSTHEGYILRLQRDGSAPERWSQTGGRPLGMAFDRGGNLIVADAERGLLSVDPAGAVTVLVSSADGIPLRFADDVDVAADGKIYFSDASVKFGAREWGTAEASVLDVMEHGGHGRLLVYDPATGEATTLLDGLNFANGVAVAHDERAVLVAESGSYRVLRVWLEGPRWGRAEPLIDALPGFPDNVLAGSDGLYWIALFAPRNRLLDSLSGRPFWRKVIRRVPAPLRPKAVSYGHVIAVDGEGRVVHDLQDPTGAYPMNTSVLETDEYLYVGSLVAPVLARLPRSRLSR